MNNTALDMTYSDTWQTRDNQLKIIGYDTYEEFLKSNYWVNTRNKLKYNPKYSACCVCKSSNQVELHHTSYKWLGTKDELRVVFPFCQPHHKEVHNIAKQTGVSVRIASDYVRNNKSQNMRQQAKKVNPNFFNIVKPTQLTQV